LKCVGSHVDESAHIMSDAPVQNTSLLWHRRLGHVAISTLRKMAASGHYDVKPEDVKQDFFCATCAKCKMTRLPFPTSETSRAEDLLDLIHTDLQGPIEVPSVDGYVYILTLLDDKSRYGFTYYLRKKKEVYVKFKEWYAFVTTKQQRNVKKVRSDRGGEYMSHILGDFFSREGHTT